VNIQASGYRRRTLPGWHWQLHHQRRIDMDDVVNIAKKFF
jgi:hypothetical protein